MSVTTPKKKPSKQIDLFHLAEEITSNIGVGIYIVHRGKFVYISPLYTKITGYSDPELIGKNSLERVHPDDRAMVREKAIKSLKGKCPESYEYRYIRKNGDIMWILEMITSILYNGRPAALGSFMDITERKKMEETLRQSEERYRTIIEEIEEGYYEVDINGNFTFVSDAICATLGYSREELIGLNYKAYIPKEQANGAYKKWREVYKTGKIIKWLPLINIKKDGTHIFVEDSIAPLRDKEGKIIGFRGITRDVTARRRMEDDLRKSEQRYRGILESIREGYFELDLEGNYTFANEANCRYLGCTKEELIGMNFRRHTSEEIAKKLYKPYLELYKTGKPIEALELESIRKNGTKAIYETSVSLIRDDDGKAIGFRGVGRDVTTRKKMEEDLRKSEEKYRTILEDMDEGYFETDLDGTFTFVNDAECRNIGYSREELIGMNHRQFQDEKRARDMRKIFIELYKTGQSIRLLDVEIIKQDGNKVFNETSVSLIRDKEGKPIGFRGISRDVTKRRQMEETIRQSEERYRTIIEEMEEWYFETDLAGNIIFFNDAFARSLGYSQKNLIGLNYRTLTGEKQGKELYEIFHQVYETGEPTKNLPYEFTRPDEVITFFELSIFPKLDREGKVFGFRGVGHDITERKRTEEQLNYIATHDLLTGLPNRMLLMDRLQMAIAQTKRNDQKLAVMMLDLDHFKNVNDTLGHMSGDELLKEIALRLTGRLRQNDTISRLGGDEFIILLPVIESTEDAVEVAKIVLESFEQPFICNDHTISTSISIGIAIYPDDCQDMDSLLKNADMAMYYVKAHGRNGYHLFAHINFNHTDQRIQ